MMKEGLKHPTYLASLASRSPVKNKTSLNVNQNDSFEENHPSWEEGTEYFIDADEESFKQSTITSQRNKVVVQPEINPQIALEHDSKKSSEALTATFLSHSGIDIKKKQEEAKGINPHQKLPVSVQNEKPFKYGGASNSEDDDYNSEEEAKSFQNSSNKKIYNSIAKTTNDTGTKHTSTDSKQNEKTKIVPQTARISKADENSEQGSDRGWINEDIKTAPKSVNGKKNGYQRFDSQSSKYQESVSTKTSPKFQYNPKMFGRKVTTKDKNMNQKEFKNFIDKAKQKVVTQHKDVLKAKRKEWRSPYRIVDKLLADAERRIKIKNMNEPKGNDTPFAHVYSKWDKGLRPKTPQPGTRSVSRYRANSTVRSESSQVSATKSKTSSTQRKMSQQRVEMMLRRFQIQEQLKQEILQRERQLKQLESKKDVEELKNNIHDKYRRTKFKEKYGTSKWEPENSEECINRLQKYGVKKQEFIKKNEEDKKLKTEAELKQYFRPQVMNSQKSWETLKKVDQKNEQKRIKVQLKKEEQRIKRYDMYEKQFELENKNTVYQRMQNDLEARRDRERKRRLLKKIKDLNYKEY